MCVYICGFYVPCRRGSSSAVAADPTAKTPFSVPVSGTWPSYLGGGRLRTENDDENDDEKDDENDDDDDDDDDALSLAPSCTCSRGRDDCDDCCCCVKSRRSRFWRVPISWRRHGER